ncbi:hypothetical protein [Rhodococcus marinonascens]|uniref:hypothetical protein n=1 Tax=Rhodococcus marinonascens TaxID=38311 RepID=UPI000ADBB10B|nr:hypothetical protein [Rhodococcus marinonascens]
MTTTSSTGPTTTGPFCAIVGGKFWYSGGVNTFAVFTWLVGASTSIVLTFVYPSPIGATIPTFAVSFVLYLTWALPRRNQLSASTPGRRLADVPQHK